MAGEETQQPQNAVETFVQHEHTTLVQIIQNLAQRVEALEKKAAQEVKALFTASNLPDSGQQ